MGSPGFVEVDPGPLEQARPDGMSRPGCVARAVLDVHGKSLVRARDDDPTSRLRDPDNLIRVSLPLHLEVWAERTMADGRADVLDHTEGIDHVETVVGKRKPQRVAADEAVGIVAYFSPKPRHRGEIDAVRLAPGGCECADARPKAATDVEHRVKWLVLQQRYQVVIEDSHSRGMLILRVVSRGRVERRTVLRQVGREQLDEAVAVEGVHLRAARAAQSCRVAHHGPT